MPAAPVISVLVPAFGAESFVDEALRSVLAQTADCWEVVAVDDASRDGTLELLRQWERRDARIRVFANATNLGMTANWNRCLSEAKGDLVLKLDADDRLRPKTLEVLLEALRSESVVGAAVRSLLCGPDGEPFGAPPADAALAAAGLDPYTDHDLPCDRWLEVAAVGNQLWSSSAFAARRRWLVTTGGWDERFGCASDTEMILRLLSAGGSFSHRAYAGLHYRVVPGSVSDVFRREGWLAWEAVVVYLRGLSACPHLLRRNRRMRQRRVVLWRRWQARSADESWVRGIPESMKARLEEAASGLSAPPAGDQVAERLIAMAHSVVG